MAIDMWDGLNIGLSFDVDEEQGDNFEISIDHDELKGDVNIEIKTILQQTLEETFDGAEGAGAMEEVVIPEFEGMKKYLQECIAMIDEKIQEGKDFIAAEGND